MHSESQVRNSILNVIALTAAVALLLLVAVVLLLLAAVPAWAQNPVLPTARDTAASPAFAAKLHPATSPAMNKPQAGASSGRPSPADVSYDNGPANGTTDARTINFGYIVSDTFVLSGTPVASFDLCV